MKKRSVGRRIALWGASALGVVLAIAMGFVGYLTITEYRWPTQARRRRANQSR